MKAVSNHNTPQWQDFTLTAEESVFPVVLVKWILLKAMTYYIYKFH